MKKHFCQIFVAGLTLFSGCATEPFKTGRPVEVNGGPFSRSFTQEGKKIGIEDLISELRQHEESRSAATSARTYQLVSVVPAAAGGYLVGYGLVSNTASNPDKGTQVLVGAGLVGLAMVLGYFADRSLVEGVEAYNGKINRGAKASVAPSIGLHLACSVEGDPFAGLQLRF